MKHIFISYKRNEDLDFAENVYNCLKDAGFTVWIDRHIHAGEEWRNQIDQAIKDAFAVVVIMTPEAKDSEYVTYEWAYASGAGIRVIPLMRKKTPLHPRLETLQYLDFTNSARPWEKLITEVRITTQAAIASEVPSFIEQAITALNSTQANVREDAIATLAQANGSDAQEVLLAALAHPIADVRRNAAEALGQMGNRDAVPKLVALLYDSDLSVRHATVTALKTIKDNCAIYPLLEMLEKEQPEEKLYIIEALGWFGDVSVIPAFINLYERSTATELRSTIIDTLNIIYSLGHIEDVSFIPILKSALYTLEETVATSAARTLLDIGSGKTIHVLTEALLQLPELQCKILVEAIKEFNLSRLIVHLEDVYQDYIHISSNSGVPSLLNHNEKQFHTRMRQRIIWILGCLKHNDTIPILIQAIDDQDKIVQYETVKVMKVLGAKRSLPALVTVLQRRAEDFDEKKLLLAVQTIGQIGNVKILPELKSFLLEMLNKHNIELSVQAIGALGRLGDYDTIGYLRNTKSNVMRNELKSDAEKQEICAAIDQAIKELRSQFTS